MPMATSTRTDIRFPGKGSDDEIRREDGTVIEREVFKRPAQASPMSMYNLDDSIRDFGGASLTTLSRAIPSILRPRTPS